jgi:hypothetical protein
VEIQEAFAAAYEELGFGDPDQDTDSDAVDGPETDDAPDDEPDEGDDPDGEPDDDGDGGGDEDDADAPVIELTEGAVLQLPDGTKVPYEKAALFQADYTKKTQALADERRQFEESRDSFQTDKDQFEQQMDQVVGWYESRQKNAAWVAAEEAAEDTDDPTLVVAKMLKSLNDAGQLDPRFAEAFGLDQPEPEVLEAARKAQEGDRVAQLEQRLQEQEEAKTAEQRQREVLGELNRQWDQIVEQDGLTFDKPDAEFQAKKDLVMFAREHGITDLGIAHAAMSHQRNGRGKTQAAPAADPKTVERKRQTRAIARKSSSAATPAPKRLASVEDAAKASVEAFLAEASG